MPDIANKAALEPVIFLVLFSGLLYWFEVVKTGVKTPFYKMLLTIKSFSVTLFESFGISLLISLSIFLNSEP